MAERGIDICHETVWMPSSKKAVFDAASKRSSFVERDRMSISLSCHAWSRTGTPLTSATPPARIGSPTLGRKAVVLSHSSFSQPDQIGGTLQPVLFPVNEDRPLAFFAGVFSPWTCVHKISEGEVACDVSISSTRRQNWGWINRRWRRNRPASVAAFSI